MCEQRVESLSGVLLEDLCFVELYVGGDSGYGDLSAGHADVATHVEDLPRPGYTGFWICTGSVCRVCSMYSM